MSETYEPTILEKLETLLNDIQFWSDGATPGPWFPASSAYTSMNGRENGEVVPVIHEPEEGTNEREELSGQYGSIYIQNRNRIFIEHSNEWIPRLLIVARQALLLEKLIKCECHTYCGTTDFGTCDPIRAKKAFHKQITEALKVTK